MPRNIKKSAIVFGQPEIGAAMGDRIEEVLDPSSPGSAAITHSEPTFRDQGGIVAQPTKRIILVPVVIDGQKPSVFCIEDEQKAEEQN